MHYLFHFQSIYMDSVKLAMKKNEPIKRGQKNLEKNIFLQIQAFESVRHQGHTECAKIKDFGG